MSGEGLVRVAGANSALAGVLAEQAGFNAVWASSLEISAMRCLPDASILGMSEYLRAAADMQKALRVPVVADCDTGFGNNLNVAHMIMEYEDAGITAVCVEDKTYPKMNSFAGTDHSLLSTREFAGKIAVAKSQQRSDMFLIARTEALIAGGTVDEALRRCRAYADAGADAVLVHSKKPTNDQIVEFLGRWDVDLPVVIVPTTYHAWDAEDAYKLGASVIIYANHGLRTMISSLRATYAEILAAGQTTGLEDRIASVSEIFALQRLDEWQRLQP
ncbi:isocitrate lyase/phosphoenolpyruvate mutase family protein [Micromonospora cathayae]|uniref:Isocitrate lyase/phosphoenolpyruvate mutase family protein n=1 Tax=Micromonospora cathayae TaxID=3028804 RepID=A0ABY7ZVM4_9ACTN|nr:isocitrate lyase/phosphoenolpyruvate mutase family protein [Micromonospora sp. HUAS 3]WDZ85839.1 isocitrate lyase/phosphoenolpyruvate mutase family protein [Micromonospora sp. HUAS 3]